VAEFGKHKTANGLAAGAPLYFDAEGNEITDLATSTGIPVIVPADSSQEGPVKQVYVDTSFDKVFEQLGTDIATNGDFDDFVPLNGTAGGFSTFNIDGNGGWRSNILFFTFEFTGTFPFFRISTVTNQTYVLNSNGAAGSDPTIQQTLANLNPGVTYQITGQYRNIYAQYGSDSGTAPTSFAVLVDGAVKFQARKSQAPASGPFQSFTAEFTATGDHATVAFAGERNGQDASYEIDNIVIRAKNTRSFITDFSSASAVNLWIDASGRKTDVFPGVNRPSLVPVNVFPGVNRPSLVPVNVTELRDFVRVFDSIAAGGGGTDVLNLVNTGDATDVSATLATYRIPVADLDAQGRPILHGAGVATYWQSPVQELYFGGEPVLDPFTHVPLVHAAGDVVVDLFAKDAFGNPKVLRDPFGAALLHEAGDPLLHTAGEPVYQLGGAFQRYLGGEPVFDENGAQVFNGDGSAFLHGADQVQIHNRLERVYDLVDAQGDLVPEGTLYTPVAFTRASLPGGTVLDLDTVAGFAYDLGAADQVAVTVYDGTRIFSLAASAFAVNATDNTLTLSSAVPTAGAQVTVTVVIATPAVHDADDPQQYFGNEPLQVGQPIVDSQGNLVLDALGAVALHTAETVGKNRTEEFTFTRDGAATQQFTLKAGRPDQFLKVLLDGQPLVGTFSVSMADPNRPVVSVTPTTKPLVDTRVTFVYRLEVKNHARGEIVLVETSPGSGEWVPALYAAGDPKVYLGNEARLHRGGEPVFHSTADPVEHALTLQRLRVQGEAPDAAAFVFGAGYAATFILVAEPQGTPSVTVGGFELAAGEFQVSGTQITLRPTVRPSETADVVVTYLPVGAEAGAEPSAESFVFGDADYAEFDLPVTPFTVVKVTIDGLELPAGQYTLTGDRLRLTPSVRPDADADVVVTFFAVPTGMPGDVLYAGLESLTLGLGAGADTITVVTTHTGGTTINAGGGDDRIAVRAISGTTAILGQGGTDRFAVGSQAGAWLTTELPAVQADADGLKFLNVLGHANGIGALLALDSTTGAETVTVDDTQDTGTNTGTLSVSGSLVTGIFGAGGSMSYLAFEQIDVHLGQGNNTLTIQSTITGPTSVDSQMGGDTINVMTIAGPTTIFTGPGADTVRVGSRTDLIDPTGTSTLNGISAPLTLAAADGADTLRAYDSGDAGPNTGRLDAASLTGLGMTAPAGMTAGIASTGFENLDVWLSQGVDAFFVHSTPLDSVLELDLGGGDDVLNIRSLGGTTVVGGGLFDPESGPGDGVQDDDTIRVNYDENGQQTFQSGLRDELHPLTLHGRAGSDLYEIGLAATGKALINVIDESPADDLGVNRLIVYGTDGPDFFLLRANLPTVTPRIGVVAAFQVDANLEPVAGGFFERVNYDGDINSTLTIYGREGADVFILDDTLAPTTIFGDAGDDTFQIGQVFASPRDGSNPHNGLADLDFFETTRVTLGYLSNGVSKPGIFFGGFGKDSFTVYHNTASIALFGEEDDDTFRVRAFVRVNPDDPLAPFTTINGGQGADFISYTVNAPVRIEGGEGLDTLVVVGTEFGDDFVITDQGVFGAGLAITYAGIEKIVVDALEGNDRFFIVSTPANAILEIQGGRGSDTFSVGGGNDGEPVVVVSKSLDGHSALVEHTASSPDVDYDAVFVPDLSVKVADNDTAGVLLSLSGGPLRVFENPAAPDELVVASYDIVLTRAPLENVRITAAPSAGREREKKAGGAGIALNGNEAGVTLLFDKNNWFIPQHVTVTAIDDGLAEGHRGITILHTVVEGANADDGDPYDGLALASLPVQVIDDDAAEVVVVPFDETSQRADDDTLVSENPSGSLPATDAYAVVLSKAPVGTVTVAVSADGEVLVREFGTSTWAASQVLTFTPGNWNTLKVVEIQAVDDAKREGIHFSRVAHAITSETDEFLGITLADAARGLGAQVAGDLTAAYTAGVAGNVLTLTNTDAPFGVDSLATTFGTATFTNVGTARYTSVDAVVGDSLSLGGTLFSLNLNGSIYSTVGGFLAAPAAVAATLAGLVNASGQPFEATLSGNVLHVTADDGSAFTASFTGGSGTAVAPTSAAFYTEVQITLAGSGVIGAGDAWTLGLADARSGDVATYVYTAGANGEVTQPGPVDVRLTDDDAPTVLVRETHGGTTVVEPTQFVLLGDGYVTQVGGSLASNQFIGDFGTAVLNEVQFHNSTFTAQDLGLGDWSRNAHPDIASVTGDPALEPHLTVLGTGNGDPDFYSFEITAEMLADAGSNGVQASFDIDHGFEFGDRILWLSLLRLYNANGDRIAQGRGFSDPLTAGAGGSTTWLDDFLAFTFTQAGRYYLEVTSWLFTSGLPVGVDYTLQVSIEQHETADFVFAPSAVLENESLQAGGAAQDIDDRDNFFTFFDPEVGNGSNITFSTPFARIQGSGDGSFDLYSFEITAAMLNPSAFAQSPAATAGTVVDPNGPFFTSVTLLPNGRVAAGDTWTLGLRYRDYAYTVQPGDNSLDDVSTGLRNLLPARYTVTVAANGALTITDPNGFNLHGLTVNGVAQEARKTATVTRSTQALAADGTTPITFGTANVGLAGAPAAGEVWSVTLDGGATTAARTVLVGDTLTSIAAALAGSLNTALGAGTGSSLGDTLTITRAAGFTLSFTVADHARGRVHAVLHGCRRRPAGHGDHRRHAAVAGRRPGHRLHDRPDHAAGRGAAGRRLDGDAHRPRRRDAAHAHDHADGAEHLGRDARRPAGGSAERWRLHRDAERRRGDREQGGRLHGERLGGGVGRLHGGDRAVGREPHDHDRDELPGGGRLERHARRAGSEHHRARDQDRFRGDPECGGLDAGRPARRGQRLPRRRRGRHGRRHAPFRRRLRRHPVGGPGGVDRHGRAHGGPRDHDRGSRRGRRVPPHGGRRSVRQHRGQREHRGDRPGGPGGRLERVHRGRLRQRDHDHRRDRAHVHGVADDRPAAGGPDRGHHADLPAGRHRGGRRHVGHRAHGRRVHPAHGAGADQRLAHDRRHRRELPGRHQRLHGLLRDRERRHSDAQPALRRLHGGRAVHHQPGRARHGDADADARADRRARGDVHAAEPDRRR